MALMRGWKTLLRGLVFRRELRGIRADLKGLRVAAERIAAVLEAQRPAAPREGSEADPLVSISYVDDAAAAEFMDIELRLTQAKGMPPSEEEIMAEYERRKGVEVDPRRAV
jgi:hypothetical protein